MMTERPPKALENGFNDIPREGTELNTSVELDELEENLANEAESGEDTANGTAESWRDETQAVDGSFDVIPDVLSTPEAAVSVTIDRKNELLLQARADRISWIQTVPLPYELPRSTDINDPWNDDERLALLKDSNAVQSLPCIPQVLSSLYGAEQNTSEDMANRIQTVLEPLVLNREKCQLATTAFTKESLAAELSNATDEEQQKLLESYHKFLTRLQTPECAMLVQGMRRFIRNLVGTQEEMASSLRSYLSSTYASLKTHAAWKNSNVDDDVKHALESFIYGQCRETIQRVLATESKEDEEFLDRLNSLQFVTSTHLEIACLADTDANELLKDAIETLLSVDSFYSPYEKLQRALKVYHNVNTALSEALNKDRGSSERLLPSADDVLPTLILSILRAKPPHIVSNLRMIEAFSPPEYLRGEAGYAFTNLYGALQFLRDLNMDNPESLSIGAAEFRRGLEESRASAKERLEQVDGKGTIEESEKEDTAIFPIEIPVRQVRAARLRGETVDLEWAQRWQEQHGAEATDTTLEVGTGQEGGEGLPDSLPSGFSRSYSYMVTRPEDIRLTDLPQLLAEYRMLVHATEQLLGERTTRLAAERKQRFATARSALLTRAAEVDLSTKTKKNNGKREK